MKESATVATRTRVPLLTPDYAAPEQWRGMAAEELDGRADLYALGGVLNEMLTGQTSFHAHNTEGWMYQHLHEEPQPPSSRRPEVANWPGLDELVLRLLAKDREQRPSDANELVALLDALRHISPAPRRVTVREETALPVTEVMEPRDPAPPPHLATPSRQLSETKSKSKSGIRSNRVVWAFAAVVLVLAGFAVKWWNTPPAGPSGDSGSLSGDSSVAEAEQKGEAFYSQNRYSEAIPPFEQACTGGNGVGCNYLGIMYLDGFGVATNGLTAIAYYSRACDLREPTGCLNAGDCYRNGTGVKRNIEKARQFLDKACTMSDEMACGELKELH
jgi:serine/threonine protein kinase